MKRILIASLVALAAAMGINVSAQCPRYRCHARPCDAPRQWCVNDSVNCPARPCDNPQQWCVADSVRCQGPVCDAPRRGWCWSDTLRRKAPVCNTPPMTPPEEYGEECNLPIRYCRPLGPGEWGNRPHHGRHLRGARGRSFETVRGCDLTLSPRFRHRSSLMQGLNLTADQLLKIREVERTQLTEADKIQDEAQKRMLKLDKKYEMKLKKILTDEQFQVYLRNRDARNGASESEGYQPGEECVTPTQKGPEPVRMYKK